MIFYCRISECRAQRLKTILNLPTCWEQISAFSKSQKIDSFDQYYTKRKSDYIYLQIISREWKYYMVDSMNFKLFDRYGGYRVLMFKFNHFNPAGLFSPNNLVLAVTLGLLGGVFRNYSVDSFFWIRSNNSVSDVHKGTADQYLSKAGRCFLRVVGGP